MKGYGVIRGVLWTRDARPLRGDPVALLLLVYLITTQHGTMIGLYYWPAAMARAELGLDERELERARAELERHGLAHYDAETEIWYVPERVELLGVLKSGDKRRARVRDLFESVAHSRLAHDFLERHGSALGLREGDGPTAPPAREPHPGRATSIREPHPTPARDERHASAGPIDGARAAPERPPDAPSKGHRRGIGPDPHVAVAVPVTETVAVAGKVAGACGPAREAELAEVVELPRPSPARSLTLGSAANHLVRVALNELNALALSCPDGKAKAVLPSQNSQFMTCINALTQAGQRDLAEVVDQFERDLRDLASAVGDGRARRGGLWGPWMVATPQDWERRMTALETIRAEEKAQARASAEAQEQARARAEEKARLEAEVPKAAELVASAGELLRRGASFRDLKRSLDGGGT